MRVLRRNSLLLSLILCISAPLTQRVPACAEDAPAAEPAAAATSAPTESPAAPAAAPTAPAEHAAPAAAAAPAPAASAPAAAPEPVSSAPEPAASPAASTPAASEASDGSSDTGSENSAESKKTKKAKPERTAVKRKKDEDLGYYNTMKRSGSLDESDKHELDRHKEQGGGYYGQMPAYKAPPPEVKPILPPVQVAPPVAAPLHHDPNERKFDDDPGKAGSITFNRHATQAQELLSTGHYDLAKKHYKEALRLKSDAIDLLPGYWETCEKTSDWSESVRTLEQLFNADPSKEKEYCWAHGEALYELRRWDRAVPTLKKACTFGKNVDRCHEWLLKIALQQKNNTEMANEYTALLKIRPSDYKMQIDFANLLELQGKHTDALTHYKAAANVQPDGTLLSRIGYMMMSYNKDWNGAIAFYNKAIQADPKNVATYQQSIDYCKSQLTQGKAKKD